MPVNTTLNMNGTFRAFGPEATQDIMRALRYGDGIFETIYIRDGKAIYLQDHLERLQDGLEIIGIDYQEEVFIPKLERELMRTVQHVGSFPHMRARIQVYRRGEGSYFPNTDLPGYFIELTPLMENPWNQNRPLHLGIYHHIPIAPSPLTRIKSCNALPYIMGARMAKEEGWDDAIMRSTDGYLIETTSSNLFVVHAATVFTPPVHGGCLPGVMRKNIIRILHNRNISVTEKHITLIDLNNADEVFITNSIQGLRPVRRIQDTGFKQANDRMFPFLRKWIEEDRPPRIISPAEN